MSIALNILLLHHLHHHERSSVVLLIALKSIYALKCLTILTASVRFNVNFDLADLHIEVSFTNLNL